MGYSQDQFKQYRSYAAANNVEADSGDAGLMADPRFQSWAKGGGAGAPSRAPSGAAGANTPIIGGNMLPTAPAAPAPTSPAQGALTAMQQSIDSGAAQHWVDAQYAPGGGAYNLGQGPAQQALLSLKNIY